MNNEQSITPLVTTQEDRDRWYRGTLNLPKTDFPMMQPKAEDRVVAESAIMRTWYGENSLYDQVRKTVGAGLAKGRPFTLHDGPPYANGDIHMGHAVNKVLKDIIVRYKTMLGFDAKFVPGWDCHGLPIEQAVQKELTGGMPSNIEFRELCQRFADKYVALQTEQFKMLGICADFDHPYLTTQREYEYGVLKTLEELLPYTYRDKKPVPWCMKHRTALADAELEYKDIRERAAYVMYDMTSPWKNFAGKNIKLMIWTTTPWTLPSNRAIAVNENDNYVIVSKDGFFIIVGETVVASLLPDYKVEETFKGSEIVGMMYKDVLSGTVYGVVGADWVTQDKGTGLVHIAPGHGPEDFALGKAKNLEIYCGADEGGNIVVDGKSVKISGGGASRAVLAQLKEAAWKVHDITHSVAHCWRCHNQVIFRATEQWFIEASFGSSINLLAMLNARDSKWHPQFGLSRFEGMLKTRPDWCISRQRSWGIPIPYFIHKPTGKAIMTKGIVSRVAQYFRCHGSNSWYTDSPEQILGTGISDLPLVCALTNGVKDFEKGTDILDVWFESGASQNVVLYQDNQWGLKYPADVYLEGSDQHRGWFQSSMLASINHGQSPSGQFITHGFVLDKDGRKMSKELGNVIKVTDAINKYGTDIVRLWVASVDYTDDMKCSDELFRNTTEMYRKLRNTLRYLLSNLYDFNPAIKTNGIDHYIMWRADVVKNSVRSMYEAYDIKGVTKAIYDFCNIDISAFYAKAIKDRMYCEDADSFIRRSAQTACYYIFYNILEMLSPIAPIMCDEVWQLFRKIPGNEEELESSVHLSKWTEVWNECQYKGDWLEIINLIAPAMERLDALKTSIGLNNALDAEAVVTVPSGKYQSFDWTELEDALGVGYLRLVDGDKLSIDFIDNRCVYMRCERSRKRRPDVGKDMEFPDLSLRDAGVVKRCMEKVNAKK